MTALAVERPTMPNGHLFESPRGLYGFQADAVAEAWARENLVAVVDLGLGKTVIFLALIAMLIEAGEIDQAIVVGKKNKALGKTEFPKDLDTFTSLRWVKYAGGTRAKQLAKAQAAGPVDVVLMTYETGRQDLIQRVKDPKRPKAKGKTVDGPLMEALDLRNRRTLWVFDEVIKLGNRGSELYHAYEYAITQGRKTAQHRVLGLHANAMATDYGQAFNIGRIVAPWMMPSVGDFEDRYTYGKDEYQRYSFRKSARTEFAQIFQQIVFRKRFTDADVRKEYPTLIEKLMPVDLEPAHRALYDAVGDLYGNDWDELTDEQLNQVRTALRLTLGHPRAHLRSDSELSRAIVATLGEGGLSEIPSTKTLRLIDFLGEIVESGHQAIVFTWFANTVMPELVADLESAGLKLTTYSGNRSREANDNAIRHFKAGDVPILVASDAGAEGMNLPEANYIVQYEPPHTYDRWSQRFGRGTRIGYGSDTFIYGRTMVCRNTLDRGQVLKVLGRNDDQDILLGDKMIVGHKDASSRKRQLMEGMTL